jgi:hypothetical protein
MSESKKAKSSPSSNNATPVKNSKKTKDNDLSKLIDNLSETIEDHSKNIEDIQTLLTNINPKDIIQNKKILLGILLKVQLVNTYNKIGYKILKVLEIITKGVKTEWRTYINDNLDIFEPIIMFLFMDIDVERIGSINDNIEIPFTLSNAYFLLSLLNHKLIYTILTTSVSKHETYSNAKYRLEALNPSMLFLLHGIQNEEFLKKIELNIDIVVRVIDGMPTDDSQYGKEQHDPNASRIVNYFNTNGAQIPWILLNNPTDTAEFLKSIARILKQKLKNIESGLIQKQNPMIPPVQQPDNTYSQSQFVQIPENVTKAKRRQPKIKTNLGILNILGHGILQYIIYPMTRSNQEKLIERLETLIKILRRLHTIITNLFEEFDPPNNQLGYYDYDGNVIFQANEEKARADFERYKNKKFVKSSPSKDKLSSSKTPELEIAKFFEEKLKM